MKNIAENNLVRFIGLSKKKDGTFAVFKVKGIKNGMMFTATITVDISAAGVDPTDSLESIIEHSSKLALNEFKKTDYHFEGLKAI